MSTLTTSKDTTLLLEGAIIVIDGKRFMRVTSVDSSTQITVRDIRWYEYLWVQVKRILRWVRRS
jgi:hypothetical protein